MEEGKRKVTMKDVAKEAGVSLGSVSRVINQEKGVKAITIQKVEEAIQRLDYVPDEYARGLKTNKSNIVALIIPTIWHPFFSEFTYFVEKELLKNSYKLLICNADGDADHEIEYIQLVTKNKADGIIAITYSDIDMYISSSLPFVSIDRHFSENVSYVTSENYKGGQIACEELIKRGSQRLAYISGVNKHKNETTERGRGFSDKGKEQGLEILSLEMPEPLENPEEQIFTFLSRHPDVDGIFTVNDFMAMRVIRVLEKMGKQVPDDCQIIGFDGLKMATDQSYLLSTIAQPIDQMARSAVELLLQMIREEENHETIISLPVKFIEGMTTKKIKKELDR